MRVPDTARLWHDADVPGLELLRAHYVRHAFAPHAHEEYALGVIEAGAQQVRLKGGRHVFPARTLALINPGDVHTGSAATPAGWTYRMFYLPPRVLEGTLPDLGRAGDLPWFPAPTVVDDALMLRLRTVHAAFEHPAATPLEKTARLAAVLAHLIDRHSAARVRPAPRPSPRDARIVRDLLEARYADPLTLDELAGAVGLHPVSLLRSFKVAFGLPPHAYQNLVRVRHARRWLRLGHAPAEVALRVGLYDQSHLNRLFKRVYGVPPGRYQVDSVQDTLRG